MCPCCLAAGKSPQDNLFWKEAEKVGTTVSFERKAGIKQMFAWCYLFVLVQDSKNELTHRQQVGEIMPWTTTGCIQLGRHPFGGKRERTLDR